MRRLSSKGVALSLSLALVSSCSLDLELPPLAQLGGLKGTLDTVPATSHVPPANVLVTVIRFQTAERYETHTDLSGVFEVDGLPPGAYQVTADIPTFAP